MSEDEIRHMIYRSFAELGRAPSTEEFAERLGSADRVPDVLRQLHDEHVIVLGPGGESIIMALPFSNVPTDFLVTSGDRRWYANCAWDALAIPTALGADARIESTWEDGGERLRLDVEGGRLEPSPGHVGFTVPARSWWDDIVFT